MKPEDASTRTRYALLLDDLATSPKARLRAVQALEQALQHEPRNEKLRRRVAKVAQLPFFEGFVVVTSTDSLDIVAVYTVPGGIDVVQVPERRAVP